MSHLDVECLMCGEVFTVFYDADMDGKHNLSFYDPTGVHTIDDSRTTPLGNIVLKHRVVSSLPKPTDSMEGRHNEPKVSRYCDWRGSMCYDARCIHGVGCQGVIANKQTNADLDTSADTHARPIANAEPLHLASGHLHADAGADTVTEVAPQPQPQPQPQPISTIAGTSVMITPQHNYVYRLDFGRRISHLMLTERDAMELSKRLRDSIRAARKAQ